MCQRIGIAKDGIYSSMREGHKYDASNFEYLDEIFKSGEIKGYEFGGVPITSNRSPLNCSRCDSDVNVDAPICISMDYNANINCIVAGQPRDRRLNVIKSFYVNSSVRFRLSSRTSAVTTRSIATRPWSIITMLPPSA